MGRSTAGQTILIRGKSMTRELSMAPGPYRGTRLGSQEAVVQRPGGRIGKPATCGNAES
ncbi:hypothetical protein Pve01_81520 [Planomonospora venezuelensis]|nr:hypothetical protein Pve01_81520 [Planomonospora venezuelensis]